MFPRYYMLSMFKHSTTQTLLCYPSRGGFRTTNESKCSGTKALSLRGVQTFRQEILNKITITNIRMQRVNLLVILAIVFLLARSLVPVPEKHFIKNDDITFKCSTQKYVIPSRSPSMNNNMFITMTSQFTGIVSKFIKQLFREAFVRSPLKSALHNRQKTVKKCFLGTIGTVRFKSEITPWYVISLY